VAVLFNQTSFQPLTLDIDSVQDWPSIDQSKEFLKVISKCINLKDGNFCT